MKTTLIALAALMVTGAAYAQNNDMNGVSFKLGMAFPLDNTLSGVNDNFTSLGIEFTTPSPMVRNTESYLSIEYFSKSLGSFGKGSAIPVTYNMRFFQKTGTARQTYAYAGLGFAVLDFIGASQTVAAVRGGFGMNISEHGFVEAGGTFTANSNTNGAFNTVGIYFGYKF